MDHGASGRILENQCALLGEPTISSHQNHKKTNPKLIHFQFVDIFRLVFVTFKPTNLQISGHLFDVDNIQHNVNNATDT